MTLRLFLRAHRVKQVTLALAVLSVLNVVLGQRGIPTLVGVNSPYAGAIFATFSPIMAALIVLGAQESAMTEWEVQGSRDFRWISLGLVLVSELLAVAVFVPALLKMPDGGLDQLVGPLRGVTSCFAVGLLASIVLDYAAQAMVVFAFGFISVNVVTLGFAPHHLLWLLPGPQESHTLWPALLLLVAAASIKSLLWAKERATPIRDRSSAS